MIFNFFRTRTTAFRWAFSGIIVAVRGGSNFWIHGFFTALAFFCGFFFRLQVLEWCAVIIVTGMVWMAEIGNSALESAVDLTTGEYHPLAKAAKDMAAGAVLIAAAVSVAVGLIIFLPKIF